MTRIRLGGRLLGFTGGLAFSHLLLKWLAGTLFLLTLIVLLLILLDGACELKQRTNIWFD